MSKEANNDFVSPTKGALSAAQMIEDIAAFVHQEPQDFYRLVIGTDSQSHAINGKSEIDFVTALIVHRRGHGARYYWRKEKIYKKPILRDKIYTETLMSLAIAQRVGKDRATVYRWLRGIRLGGLREFVEDYRGAKKGPRRRKVNPYIERRVLSLRREHRECCGEKVVYWLAKEGIHLSRSSVYRVLNKHLQLRARGHRNRLRGPVPRGEGPRQVIQMDTVVLGELYAYTAVDTYTREAQVVLLPGLTGADGLRALEEVMAYFGCCEVLQTDGGREFGGVFEEKVRCYVRRHRVARPYEKNEQAFVESFHRSLRRECVGWWKYKRSEQEELEEEVRAYLDYYHHERPHLGLGMRTPLPLPLSHLI